MIEANPRASRTVPFVSKALGIPMAKAASRIMAGSTVAELIAEGMTNRVICVRDDQIVNVDIDEGLAMKKTLNAEEFEVMTVMTGV